MASQQGTEREGCFVPDGDEPEQGKLQQIINLKNDRNSVSIK